MGRRPLAFVPLYALAMGATLVGAPSDARADVLDDVRKGGTLFFGADQEGGGPYVYPREDDPKRTTGFEVDLADSFGRALGARSELYQGDWGKLPQLLAVKKIHIVLNGYEWSESRAEKMEATIPYYVYALQLLVRKDDTSVVGLDDFATATKKRKLGVLSGSAAHTYVAERLGDRVDVVLYDGNTDAMREVETEKIDGALEDTPIAAFYGPRFPRLRTAGPPVAKGYYVAFAEKGERRLVEALNVAIARAALSGELERIDRAYGIWDERQGEIREIARAGKFFGQKGLDVPLVPEATTEKSATTLPAKTQLAKPARGLQVVAAYGTDLLRAAGMTALLACLSFPLALALGMSVALGRVYGPKSLRAPLGVYVEFLRGTPLMLQLYFLFFVLPEVGVRLPAFVTSIVGLAINYSAYESEIYRAGLLAVPEGQMEAALSLGMTRGLAIRRIIGPQAFRMVIPPVVNDFIALFKDTSLCSVVTVVELTKRYSILSQSTQAIVELMTMTALLYLAMSYPLSVVARKLEERLDRDAGGEADLEEVKA